ncbi:MarR family winged helix-turn-helix transcriptional regulator [Lacticaseibacillus brantae]|uniref:HTH-type transcriptional regulator SarZ n=1 Tax=Lacticaseibacillus brantae DSM 23927 TaxID=1423727 RepID=A0A0R2B9X1_9LACO|nr:MarR family transcriptional regulator [Lacticaseibacillus brantae]KRM72371.1 Transcriptional regulator [Lacticaseibacillus brantae DSM 23927]
MVEPLRLDDQLCFALYKAQKQFNHFYAKALAPYQLTYPQYISLLSLYEHGTMSVKALGQTLDLDSGTLTPLLKRLEKDDWIVRSRSTEDERRVDVSLTDKALGLRDEIFAHVGSCMELLDMAPEVYAMIRGNVAEVDSQLSKIDDEQLTAMK